MSLLRDGETEAQRPEVGGKDIQSAGIAPARVQGFPGASRVRSPARSSAVRGLTSSTTRPSGCPSAPTSRYTSGFPAEDDASLAPPPLQARAAERRSGQERGTGSRPSRREPQRSANIAARVESGRETGGANGKSGSRGHRHPKGRVLRGRAPPPLLARQASRPRPPSRPSGQVRGRPLPAGAGNSAGLVERRSVKSFELHEGQTPEGQT